MSLNRGAVFAIAPVLVLGAVVGVEAQDVSHQQGEIYPPLDLSFAQVWSGGYWKQDETEGYFRFVVTRQGFEHLSNQLYIEWVEFGDAPGKERVAAMRPVTELNEPPVLVFKTPVCTDAPACNSIELETVHTYTQQSGLVRIWLKGVGIYDILSK